MGAKAVELLLEGQTDVMVGLEGMGIVPTPLEEVISRARPAPTAYYEMAKMLAR